MSGDSDAVSIFKSLPDLFKLAISIEKDSLPGRINAVTTLLALILTAVLNAGPPLLELAANFVLAWKSGASRVPESSGFDASVILLWFLFMIGCMIMTTATHIATEKLLGGSASKKKKRRK